MIINMNGAKAPETPSPTLQEKTVTPETLPTVIGADEGYDGLSQVTVNPDSQLIPANIRSGKTVFGVEGSFVGEPQPMTDPEAQFWMDLATSNSPYNPANAPAGLIQHPFKSYAFYDKHIGPEGLDLSLVGLPENMYGLYHCMQYFKDSNGEYHLGGDIVLPEGTNGHGECLQSYLKDVPVGLLNYAWAFSGASFNIEKLVVKPENLPDNVAGGFELVDSFYFEDNKIKYRPLTLELPANITSVESISGTYKAKMRLVMKATVPPSMGAAYMVRTDTLSAIVVPVGSLEAYQTATNWSASADIMEEGAE